MNVLNNSSLPATQTVTLGGETVTLTAYVSETARYPGFRESMQPFCTGAGLDIGFGGDPINNIAMRMDFPQPYVYTGDAPVQLGGDCRDLYWFNDNVLDFIYSSHVLEDFAEGETDTVLREWARVLKPGGHLALLLPDQPRYVAHCEANGERPNDHHSIAHFSLSYVQEVAARLGGLETVHEQPEVGPYSFAVVFRKTGEQTRSASDDLHQQVQAAWEERDALRVRLRGAAHELDEARSHAKDVRQELARLEGTRAVRLAHWLGGLKEKVTGGRVHSPAE